MLSRGAVEICFCSRSLALSPGFPRNISCEASGAPYPLAFWRRACAASW